MAACAIAAIPASGLVGEYQFSGNANDSAATAHGVVHGAVSTADRFGRTNRAYQFDGTASYIEIPDNDAFSVTTTGSLSISVWVRPDGTSTDATGNLLFNNTEGSGYVHWMGKGTSDQREWAFRIYSADNTDSPNRGNRMSSYLFNPAGGLGAGGYVQERVVPGEWIHCVCVIDAAAQTITWFKNGVQRDQDSFAPGSNFPVTPANGTAPLRIGTRDFASYFAGAIDDLRIYDRILSAAEIGDLQMENVPGYGWSNFTGLPGGIGNADAAGNNARFWNPSGVAVDASGNVYVADMSNHTIRKISPAGDVSVLAGFPGALGTANGTGSDARFWNPQGVAWDAMSGLVYVLDKSNQQVRAITTGGTVSVLAGGLQQTGTADGAGAAARFNNPQAFAVDAAGNLFVADSGNHTIRKVTAAGVVTTVAGIAGSSGSTDGASGVAQFKNPAGIAVDASGNLFVADTGNHTIRMITPGGVVSTLAGSVGSSGSSDGTGSAAKFNTPMGLTIAGGNVIVADKTNALIRQVTSAGVVTTLAGTAGSRSGADGTGAAARFHDPQSVAVDGSGNVFIADTTNCTIRKMAAGAVVTTFAGLATNRGSTNGTGTAARFFGPEGAVLDSSGNLFVADTQNHTIRKVTPAGVVTLFAGTAGSQGSTDATGTVARFRYPQGLAIDTADNLYVADTGNHTIRKITPSAVVTTLAGLAQTPGSADGAGSAARFNNPNSLAVDAAGDLYVTDASNHTIRKMTAAGVVTTFAGLAGSSGTGNGTGSAARFNTPCGIAIGPGGNLYVADTNNHFLRMITPGGVVTTAAGAAGASGSADGPAGLARFRNPRGIAFDSAGSLFIADVLNHTIRKMSPAATVVTIGGSAGVASSADGAGAAALFSAPRRLAVSGAGEVYLADTNNNRVSIGTPRAPLAETLAATAVSTTSATLNGTVNPNGNTATAQFEYGPDTNYGATIPLVLTPNDDLAEHPFHSTLSGLIPATTYHYRIVSSNSAGTTAGQDATFTTPNQAEITVEQPAGVPLGDGTSTVDIGSAVAGGGSVSKTFTLRSTGTLPLSGISVSVDGTNANEFQPDTTGMATTLPVGGSTTFTVTFSPLVSGPRAAALHILSNDPAKSSFDVALAGTGALPTGWTSADVGSAVPVGGTMYDSATQQFTVSGGGNLVASGPNTEDQFQFAFQNVTGDFIATAKIESVSVDPNSGAAPRAGLMLRATSDPLAPYAMIGARRDGTTGSTQTSFESWRVHSGDQPIQTHNSPTAVAPFWVRITRWGDKVRMQVSWDGTRWASNQGMILDNLPATVCVGLAAASRDSALATTAVFSNVSVVPLTLDHESSWIGNTIGGSYYGPHIMNAVHDLAIDSVNGVLVMGGEDETREMHIFDLDGNFRYVARNTSYNGGQQKEVTLDGTNIFSVGPNGVERWRYDGFRTHLNSLGSPTPKLVGITLAGANVYAVDSTNQQVRVFAKADLTENAAAAFTVANAKRITTDASGFLWIAQDNSGSEDKVLRYSTAGVAQAEAITLFADSVVAGVTVHPGTGEIWVADRGPRQQFHVFSAGGAFIRSVGAPGGIYSSAFGTIPGQPHPMKFNSPTDVEFDSAGNMYVACMGASNRWTQGSGTEVRKFDTSGNQLWEQLCLVYVDNADPVPGTNGTEVYTQTRRITVDYSKPVGQQWTYAGYTFDPFTYPEDARATQNQPSSALMRMIGGQKIMFITEMNGNWVATYRFLPGSEIAIPCGLIKRETNRGQPGNTFYIWVDADGDGAVDAGEVDTSLAARSEVWGFTVDENGGLWAADRSTDKIRHYPCKGLNAIGAPTYGANYPGTSEREWAAPAQFIGGSKVYPIRAKYDAGSDELYIGGYRVGREELEWNWKAVGSCLGRYTGWLAGAQSESWFIDLPQDPAAVLLNGDGSHATNITACMAVAGDYVFAVYTPTLDVFVYNRWTGAFVQTLDAGPEICGNQALLDIVNGLSAMRRSNGEYVIWIEDDGAQKVNMYRWTPANACEITIEQPAGAALSDGVSSVAFGSSHPGTGVPRTFTIRNDGATSLFDLSVNVDGPNAGDFVPGTPGVSTLAPGASTTVTVTFTPPISGSRSAALHMLSNDADEASFDIALTGTGITASEEWRQAYFGQTADSGDAADLAAPDGDGIENVVKYALVIAPGAAGNAVLPAGQRRTYFDGERLAVIFTRDPSRDDVTIEVQVAGSLAGPWDTAAASVNGGAFSGAGLVGEANGAGGLKTVEVRDPINPPNASQRFMRFRITR